MSNWKPSSDAVELLDEIRESIIYWEKELEKHERFRGGDLRIDENLRNINDRLLNLKFMKFIVVRNAFP